MCSGITSASTASNAFAGFLSDGFGLGLRRPAPAGILALALGFMALVAAINFRGVGESVKANVVLTCVELSGLLLIIFVGFWAMSQGRADFTEVMVFRSSEEKSAFMALTAATSLAFFAMVGFEDSVNMAEEMHQPGARLPAGDADRARDHRGHLHPGLDLRRGAGAGRRPRRHRARARR